MNKSVWISIGTAVVVAAMTINQILFNKRAEEYSKENNKLAKNVVNKLEDHEERLNENEAIVNGLPEPLKKKNKMTEDVHLDISQSALRQVIDNNYKIEKLIRRDGIATAIGIAAVCISVAVMVCMFFQSGRM